MRADDIGAIFGHRPQLLARNSPADTLPAAAPGLRRAQTYVWFYTGTDDGLLAQNRQFADELEEYGIPHRFYVVRGGHNWALWRGNAAKAYLAASRRVGVA